MRCTDTMKCLMKHPGEGGFTCLRQGLWRNPSCGALYPCRPPGAPAGPREDRPLQSVWGERAAAGPCSLVKVGHSVVSDSVTPRTTQSLEFSRPECWSGQPFPSPGNLPNPGTEPRSPAWQVGSLPVKEDLYPSKGASRTTHHVQVEKISRYRLTLPR